MTQFNVKFNAAKAFFLVCMAVMQLANVNGQPYLQKRQLSLTQTTNTASQTYSNAILTDIPLPTEEINLSNLLVTIPSPLDSARGSGLPSTTTITTVKTVVTTINNSASTLYTTTTTVSTLSLPQVTPVAANIPPMIPVGTSVTVSYGVSPGTQNVKSGPCKALTSAQVLERYPKRVMSCTAGHQVCEEGCVFYTCVDGSYSVARSVADGTRCEKNGSYIKLV